MSVFLAILKALRNPFQRLFLLCEFVGGAFKIFVVADVFLHRGDINALFVIADKLGNKPLHIVVGIEGNRLFQQIPEFIAQAAQKRVYFVAVGFSRIKETGFFDIAALEIIP